MLLNVLKVKRSNRVAKIRNSVAVVSVNQVPCRSAS
ncbi:hypothetical protein B0G73_107279 [Paraburkholderia sp. BL25I1N1]|nr:hypothetical protein B0G73_107279 [Paraburkholderia sp. BL25I1N1]